jgi:hypothetical protein
MVFILKGDRVGIREDGNNKTGSVTCCVIILVSVDECYTAILLPHSFHADCIPGSVHPPWYVREHPRATEHRLGEQQIDHRFSKYGGVVVSHEHTTGQALRGAVHGSSTEVQDDPIGFETAFEASVTERTIPCIMHPVTIVQMHQDA